MKRLLIILFVLMAAMPIAMADTDIFSGKAITDSNVQTSAGNFKFTYEESSNKVFVQTPTTSIIVKNGECISNSIFRVCIKGVEYYDKNITTYVYYYKVDTTISQLTGSLSVNVSATVNPLLPGETADIQFLITNPTDLDVSNIYYSENLSIFNVQNAKGCDFDGYTLSWQGSLKPKNDKACTVTIMADKSGTYNILGKLAYFNGYEAKKESSGAFSLTILPLQLNVSRFFDGYIETNQPFSYNVSLYNAHATESIELTATLDLQGVELLKKLPEFSINFNTYTHHELLSPGSSFNYSLNLQAIQEESVPVRERYDYKIKGISNAIESTTTINVFEPKPLINMSAEFSELTPGQKFIVLASLGNPSRIYELKNIKASLNVPYNAIVQQALDRLKPNESYSIISSTFIVPSDPDLIAGMNNTMRLALKVDYSAGDSKKSIGKVLELKVKNSKQPVYNNVYTNITQNTTGNSTSVKAEVQAPQPAINPAPIPQPVAEPEKKSPSFVSDIMTRRTIDFSDKRMYLLLIGILAIIFGAPLIFYYIRKRKRASQPGQNIPPSQPENPFKPKGF